MAKQCWEFMQCGREPGGRCEAELGPCPVATEESFDGLNGGQNAGRICWAVAGTFCGEQAHGLYASRLVTCLACDFYQRVKAEVGPAHLVVSKPKEG